jgi:hypothetical protein
VLKYIPFVAIHCVLDAGTVHVVNMFTEHEALATTAREAYEVSMRALEQIQEIWGYAEKAISILTQLKEERQDLGSGSLKKGRLTVPNHPDTTTGMSVGNTNEVCQPVNSRHQAYAGDTSWAAEYEGLSGFPDTSITSPPTLQISDQLFWDQILWSE